MEYRSPETRSYDDDHTVATLLTAAFGVGLVLGSRGLPQQQGPGVMASIISILSLLSCFIMIATTAIHGWSTGTFVPLGAAIGFTAIVIGLVAYINRNREA